LCNEGLVVVGWIRLIFMKQILFKYIYIYIYIYVRVLHVPEIRPGVDAIGSL
jgi:hypothetical protein